MSYKVQTIFIRPARLDGGPEQLLADLGFHDAVMVGEASFYSGGHGSIWIGAFDDCIVMSSPLAWQFFAGDQHDVDPEFESFRDALFRRFAAAQISVLCLNGVVGAWGIAVFQGGKLIRCSHGYDLTVVCNDGVRLQSEQDYLQRFERRETEDGIRYRDPQHPDSEEMSEADLGESLTAAVFESISGLPIDDPRFNPDGVDFWLSEAERRLHFDRIANAQATQRRPWWKFW